MPGWMIVFALLMFSGAFGARGPNGSPFLELTSILFGILFVVTVAARFMRGRA